MKKLFLAIWMLSIAVAYAQVPGNYEAPPGGGGGGAPSPVGTGLIAVTEKAATLIFDFGYTTSEVYVAPPELFGVLGALDSFPIPAEQKDAVNRYAARAVKTLEGDPYSLAATQVLGKYMHANKVIIARGDLGVDALASIAYARALGVPILLVEPKEIPKVTSDALGKLGTKSVVIVGGTVAVSKEVEAKLPSPARIWGQNREETAVKIAEELMKEAGPRVGGIVVTDGRNPDPNAVMVAAWYNAPIVYVEGDKLPTVTKRFIEKHSKSRRIITVGISDAAQSAVKDSVGLTALGYQLAKSMLGLR